MVPSADKVYRAGVERLLVPGLPPIDSDSSVNTLTFSRYPLRPAIVIEAVPQDCSLPLHVAVFAINQKIKIPVPALFDENTRSHR